MVAGGRGGGFSSGIDSMSRSHSQSPLPTHQQPTTPPPPLTAPFETTILRSMEGVSGASIHLAGPKFGPKTNTVAFATAMYITLELGKRNRRWVYVEYVMTTMK
jgi:hypothetical protein